MTDITFTIKESHDDMGAPIYQLYTEVPLQCYQVITELYKSQTTLAEMEAFVAGMNARKMTTDTSRADIFRALDAELKKARPAPVKVETVEAPAKTETVAQPLEAPVKVETVEAPVKAEQCPDTFNFEVVDARAYHGVAVHRLTVTPAISGSNEVMEFAQCDFKHGAILLLAQTLNGEDIQPGQYNLDGLRAHCESILTEIFRTIPELTNKIVQKKIPAKKSAFPPKAKLSFDDALKMRLETAKTNPGDDSNLFTG